MITMTKMITLFGRDLSELHFNDLKRERRCHSFLLTRIKMLLNVAYADAEKHPESTIQADKVAFFEMYKEHLEAVIRECDYLLERRCEPLTNATHRNPKSAIKRRNARVRQRRSNDVHMTAEFKQALAEGLNVSWDRDKFMLIASDRGYQTEEAVTAVMAKELNLSYARMKSVLNYGRFSWGQVLVTGAFMQMTPKEFCDTFLAGYFTEMWGEYRADMEAINKAELLKRVQKDRDPFEGMEAVEVGSDGRPIDEEEWFD